MTAHRRLEPRRTQLYWMPVVVLALGAASILLLLANNEIQQSLIAPDVGSLRAVAEIQTRITAAHLWIEEYVTGDQVDLGEIERSLDRAQKLADSLEQAQVAQPGWPLPSPTPSIKDHASRVAATTRRFSRLTRERRAGAEAGAEVGIGSAVDVGYDQVYADLVGQLNRLEQALVLRLTDSERRAAFLFRGLLVAWSTIVLLAAAGLWTRDRRQRLIESALGDSQAQLLQAQKMDAVGRLAGGLAHDINNYLAAIAAQSELVKMKAEPGGDTATRMDAVLATTARAGTLIERLLAFSRRQPARPQAVDVNRTLHGLDPMLSQLLGADIELVIDTAPEIWPVEIDVSQLEQIVLNLAVNAREAMPDGGRLTVATRQVPGTRLRRDREARSDHVSLTVTDTGTGIPEEVREKMFEPFFTTKENTHSGLGLATVLGVVEQNGGRIRVESTEAGTSFEVLLPRTAGEPEIDLPEQEIGARPAAASERILLVEDDAEVRRATCDLLTTWGYRVTAVGLGREAVSVFEKSRDFDLLITDVVMPGMSGREVAERLRADAPRLPVLFISGNTDEEALRKSFEGGEFHLLGKPFSARQLSEHVQAALARTGSRAGSADSGL